MQHLRTVLPRHDDCSTVGAMAASPDSRVLVVLDDAPFGATVHRVIESAGFRPFLVASARDAHALIERGLDPCVVLFALTSSEEGRRFIARHGADPRWSAIPVIFYAARPRDAGARAPIAAALVAFVQSYCTPSSVESGSSALH